MDCTTSSTSQLIHLVWPMLVAQLYSAGRRAEVGREIHQSVWISQVLALVAALVL